jgi:IPT/TIG domain
LFTRIATALLLTATAAFAGPTIASVTPNVGPVAGGTLVRIKGAGFSNNCIICSPPFASPGVLFGSTSAAEVRFIDSTTLDVVTPTVLPSTVSLTVNQFDGSSPTTLLNAFTFQGDPNSGFDPVLFPLFNAPIQGALGSEFHTTVSISNKGLTSGTLPVYGISFNGPLDDPPRGPLQPYAVNEAETQVPLRSQTPGRLLYVPKGAGDSLAASIRVTDVTKQATSFGVEVPVVRRDDFDDARLVFMGIPSDPRFRCMLRLYSVARGNVLVNLTVNGILHQVELKHTDDQDIFDPAYLEFTSFPTLFQTGGQTFRIVADTGRGPGGVVIPGTPIWGMVSVTNNETQQITIIAPN